MNGQPNNPAPLMDAMFRQAARPAPAPDAGAFPADDPAPVEVAAPRKPRKKAGADQTIELKLVLPRRAVAALKAHAGSRLTTASAVVLAALKAHVPAIGDLFRKAA